MLGILDDVEELVEFFMGHVRVTIDTLLVLVGGVSVVLDNFFHSLGEDSLAVSLSASQECATRGSAGTILELLEELSIHIVDVCFLERLLSVEYALIDFINVSVSDGYEQEADDGPRR